MKGYVSGPYTGDTPEKTHENVQEAILQGITLMTLGHTPVIPHLYYYLSRKAFIELGLEFNYERWMKVCFDFLEDCDALLYLRPSPGADRELERAKKWERGYFLM